MRFLSLLAIAILLGCTPARPTRAQLIEEASEACVKGYAQHSSSSAYAKYAASGKSTPLSDDEIRRKSLYLDLGLNPHDPVFKCFNGFVTKDGYKIEILKLPDNGVSE